MKQEVLLSLCVRDLEERNPSSSTLSNSTTRRRREQFNSGESRIIFRINFHKQLIGLTIVGKYAWQQKEQKGDGTALIFQEQLFISELFKDIQDAISLILLYRTMWKFRADSSNIFITLDVLFNLHSIINSGFIPGGEETDSILFAN